MTDLISRQALIDKLSAKIKTHRSTIEIVDKLIPMIEDLPSVEPKQEWISVEDRLPEEYGEYMITWVSDQTNKPLISIAEYEITDDFDRENCGFLGEWLFDEYMSAYTNIKVTAWCELPTPYKGDKENK